MLNNYYYKIEGFEALKRVFYSPDTMIVGFNGSPIMTARVEPRADKTAADQKSSPNFDFNFSIFGD